MDPPTYYRCCRAVSQNKVKFDRNHNFLALYADSFGKLLRKQLGYSVLGIRANIQATDSNPAHISDHLFPWGWEVMQHRLITGYRYFEAKYWSYLQESSSPVRPSFWATCITFRQSEDLEISAAEGNSA